ncbi:MAG: hypothetical protein JXQ75_16255 [Phycisphaerae bacterium]|nr:hypothetical protein [Phycisphaerae bacterium]
MRRKTCPPVFALSLAAALFAASNARLVAEEHTDDQVVIRISGIPAHGIAMSEVDLTGALGGKPVEPGNVRALERGGGVPCQFVPAADFDSATRVHGFVLIRVPAGQASAELKLRFDGAAKQENEPFDGTARTAAAAFFHDPAKQGGLPWQIRIGSTDQALACDWHDRLYQRDPPWGGCDLIRDRHAKVTRISAGAIATAVRVAAKYLRADGSAPDSRPGATYTWIYFHDLPLVFVHAAMSQATDFDWNECHFLEFSFPKGAYDRYVGADRKTQGEFIGNVKVHHFQRYAGILTGDALVGMMAAGDALVYDNKSPGESYLQAAGDLTWRGWSGKATSRSAWLWVGQTKDAASTLATATATLPDAASTLTTTASVLRAVADAQSRFRAATPGQRRKTWPAGILPAKLQRQGRLAEAEAVAKGALPQGWTAATAGRTGMMLEKTKDGIRLVDLVDSEAGAAFLGKDSPPLFMLRLKSAADGKDAFLSAESGWDDCSVTVPPDDSRVALVWKRPKAPALAGLGDDFAVSLSAKLVEKNDAIVWDDIRVHGVGPKWSVWEVVMPRTAFAELSPEAVFYHPDYSGVATPGMWRKTVSYKDTYPGATAPMPFWAAYDEARRTGLYMGIHDPLASTKDFELRTNTKERTVYVKVTHVAENAGKPGNDYRGPGAVVWRTFTGDWFDACLIYRDWVRAAAKWYPKLAPDKGRADTPLWMRELPLWILGGGTDYKATIAGLRKVQKEYGVPFGIHWYRWHQIPFDNDYPHYFPAADGFVEAVAEVQRDGIYVMPYINGRLWDVQDRGAEDFQFSKVALPAATKNPKGEPNVERYGSKNPDGSRVKLAVMCPATRLWQDKIGGIVGRLFNEVGVASVYIDQISACRAVYCYDPTHGHPIGGGHWWSAGYWQMMDRIREKMPEGRMVTSECNAEPFVRHFDGYLTWHWQNQDQVPAFAAVYGGAIQIFGRAYHGGQKSPEEYRLACRMKAAEQLRFGEQIGWFDYNQALDKDLLPFFRQIVALRWKFRRYFYTGEMARPPKLTGSIPLVSADWRWGSGRVITSPAAGSGAWRIPERKKVVLFFTNVADEPVEAMLDFDASQYGLAATTVRITPCDGAATPGKPFEASNHLQHALTLPAKSAVAWELEP